MTFDDVDEQTSMHDLAIQVAEEMSEQARELFASQHARNLETDGAMANVVLTAMTLVWLEAVHAHWNTVSGESAMSLLRGLSPDDKGKRREMKRAARDFLRRSGWWIRRSK